ncbi:MAG: class I SAM-dependent methyltransferase [Thermoplasmata archaeon]|nr:class I SAM-dependent methyltransferase [Thermoplasmata archaeon]
MANGRHPQRRTVRRHPTSEPVPVPHVRKNLRLWQSQSAEYDRRFTSVLSGPRAEAWGFDRVPESELDLLGAVRGRDVLELGCGAARWSVALARRGARAVGLDFSSAQLDRAQGVVAKSGARVRLIRASAEAVPIRDGTFDLIFCDWGAMTFCDPQRTVPECARLLRPGGRLVFATASPIATLAWNLRSDRISPKLRRDYFGLHRIDFPKEVNFQLPYGAWIALFRENGLQVERLVEPRMGRAGSSRYLSGETYRWGKRWPLEAIWSVRKEGGMRSAIERSGPRRGVRERS